MSLWLTNSRMPRSESSRPKPEQGRAGSRVERADRLVREWIDGRVLVSPGRGPSGDGRGLARCRGQAFGPRVNIRDSVLRVGHWVLSGERRSTGNLAEAAASDIGGIADPLRQGRRAPSDRADLRNRSVRAPMRWVGNARDDQQALTSKCHAVPCEAN